MMFCPIIHPDCDKGHWPAYQPAREKEKVQLVNQKYQAYYQQNDAGERLIITGLIIFKFYIVVHSISRKLKHIQN